MQGRVTHDDRLSDSANNTMCPVLVCLLGPFRLMHAGHTVHLRSESKRATLLAMLALRQGRPVARDTLLDALWPDSPPDLASQALHSLVRDLHKYLRVALGHVSLIVSTDGAYRLHVEAGVSVDVGLFDSLVDIGQHHRRAGNETAAITSFEEALRLYRGDLCLGADLYATGERERLRNQYLTLLIVLAEYRYNEGDYRASLAFTQRLLAHDPCREDAHRLAIRCHVWLGERAQALRQYQRCAHALRVAFDAGPEPATMALFERVRTDPSSI